MKTPQVNYIKIQYNGYVNLIITINYYHNER